MYREIPLSRGLIAIVDEFDYDMLIQYPWHVVPCSQREDKWYARTSFGKINVPMHRFIMKPPKGILIDHIDNNGLHNFRKNLRLATNSQNCINRRYENKSGYRGVYGVSKRFKAIIEANGRAHRLGHFIDPAEAARAYDRAAIELHGEFAVLNFPNETRST